MRPPDPRLLGFLAAYDRSVSDLALALREMVLQEAPEAIESIYDAYSAVAISFSYTGRLKDTFCHIATYAQHVNLGLNRGAHLPDPQKMLEGTGTNVRHIRVARRRDLTRPFVRDFIRAAHQQVCGPGPVAVAGPKSIVKGNYPNKRRP